MEDKNQNKNHSELSAEIAYVFFKSNDIFLKKDILENILHSIKAHSYSNNITPKTIEAKSLSDADKLDAIGAIGLYRTIGYTPRNNGNLDNVIEHIEKKILNLKDQLYFEESREIAYTRHKFIQEFYNQILQFHQKKAHSFRYGMNFGRKYKAHTVLIFKYSKNIL